MIQISEAIKQAGIIKEMVDSPEFEAAVEKLKTLEGSSAEEKVEAIKGILPFLIPIGDFAKTILGKKGDATVDEISGILKAIYEDGHAGENDVAGEPV